MKNSLLVLALLFAALLPCAAARADESPPNCFGKSDVCVGPSVSVGLLGYNLVTHSVSVGALPVGALGVEVSAFTSQWYRTGLSFNVAAVAQQNGANYVTFAPILSFAKYLRVGMLMQTVGDTAQWTVLVGGGITGGAL